ncbi:MAG: 16S rRNA (cytosine(967)-C(5))-methyltransferase RsmB [Eubacterium sp.]|nr:16S rRNA (cytosine(967)-C(5))-methyltransferase RsmB [Eubacterium sp.]
MRTGRGSYKNKSNKASGFNAKRPRGGRPHAVIKYSPRETAFMVLMNVRRKGAYSNIELGKALKGQEYGAFSRGIVYGTLSRIRYLDYILDGFIDAEKTDPVVMVILEMGLYQIVFMNSVPDHSAVDEAVELAKKHAKKATGLVNAVLRNYLRKRDSGKLVMPENDEELAKDTIRYISVVYSCSEPVAELLVGQYGKERAESILAASNETPELCLTVNTNRITAHELVERLRVHGFSAEEESSKGSPEDGFVITASGGGILDSAEFADGLFFVQDRASVRAVKALADAWSGKIAGPPGLLIDVCAAPGGKSFAAAIIIKPDEIISRDVHPHKIKLINDRAGVLGLEMIKAETGDASLMPAAVSPGSGIKVRRKPAGSAGWPKDERMADMIICDVPCSGLGVMRRKPEIKYKNTEFLDTALTKMQYTILKASFERLKTGGMMMYSTCTLNRAENEDIVRRFTGECSLANILDEKTLFPDTDGTDGFYYCIIEKQN